MWLVTRDMLNVTCDTCHMTHSVGWTFSQNFSSLALLVWDWECLELIFKASALWADAFYKSKCPSVCVFVCPSVCLFTFEVPFNDLFAPTSQSQMSNIFRDSEFVGKSNGKKWSNIWTFLFGSGLKSPRKKRFFCWFCIGPPSYGIGATIRIGREMLCLPYAGFLIEAIPKFPS